MSPVRVNKHRHVAFMPDAHGVCHIDTHPSPTTALCSSLSQRMGWGGHGCAVCERVCLGRHMVYCGANISILWGWAVGWQWNVDTVRSMIVRGDFPSCTGNTRMVDDAGGGTAEAVVTVRWAQVRVESCFVCATCVHRGQHRLCGQCQQNLTCCMPGVYVHGCWALWGLL